MEGIPGGALEGHSSLATVGMESCPQSSEMGRSAGQRVWGDEMWVVLFVTGGFLAPRKEELG